jgi:hypothetical protein
MNLETDPEARRYSKRRDVVDVEIAGQGGALDTLEGQVTYRRGDALITGVAGERWPVERTRFDATYGAEAPTKQGQSGRYRRRQNEVLARQISSSFETVTASGATLRGQPGDWLVQYENGDQSVVRQNIFAQTYLQAAT